MGDPIPPSVKKLWEHWNIRGAMMFSLFLQSLLIFFAPFRKRTSRKLVIMLIWSAYLLADAIANFAVGLISNSQTNADQKAPSENGDLLAFWAPFLLLHLGGPDTITAFSLEDNELWLRHLLALVVQAIATGYVFAQTLTKNRVMAPTFLLFAAGIIKYLERTRSLYLASMDRFRDSMLKKPDAGPNYAKLMEEYASKKQAGLPTQIIMIPEPEKEILTDTEVKKLKDQLEVVQKSFQFFKIFKGLVVDLIFSFKERNDSREFFINICADDALKVIEAELNFIYEALFTKVAVVQTKWGYFFRTVGFCSVVSALAVFHFHVEKHNFNGFDVGVTYALLFGAIGLDIIAFLMAILSDWRAAALIDQDDNESPSDYVPTFFNNLAVRFFREVLAFKMAKWRTYETENNVKFTVPKTSIFLRRWSGSIKGHNLVRYCLKGSPTSIFSTKKHIRRCVAIQKVHKSLADSVEKVIQITHLGTLIEKFVYLKDKVIELIGLKDFVDEITYASKEPVTKELWKFIFTELQRKSLFADDPEMAKRIYWARGDWILQEHGSDKHNTLMTYVSDVTYDQSILLWHVATELLFNNTVADKGDSKNNTIADKDRGDTKNNTDKDDATNDPNKYDNAKDYSYREFSKVLSDYMLYLLIMQPNLMAAVAGIGKIRFQDTCAEAQRFFKRKGLRSKDEKEACEKVLRLETQVKPVAVKGDRSKSVLFDGSRLAKELEKLGEKKWEVLSKVWVELLSYAASHCRANAHAQQISKGGELLTFVWLLMAHFGLGDLFQINEGHARAKLIVGK